MSWLELDDGILEHPKFIRLVKLAGSEGVHLWLGLRAYCGRHLTDGCIPSDMLDEVRGPTSLRRRSVALRALFDVGLLEKTSTGVQMHDFLDWSRSREDVTAMRERARERKAKSRASHSVTPAVTPRAVTPVVTLPSPLRSSPLPSTPRREEPPLPPEGGGDAASGVFASAAPSPGQLKQQADTLAVFEAWRRETGHQSAIFDRKRSSRIAARLRDGFTAEQLVVAIRNRRNDPHLMGSSGRVYDGIETLLRDVAQVERLIALKAPMQAKPQYRPDPRNEVQDLRAEHASRQVLRDLDQSAKIRSEYEAAKRMFEAPNGQARANAPQSPALTPPRVSNGHLKGAANGQ